MSIVYFESRAGRIYYESFGDACAPPIVFCHGVSMDHRTFDGQVSGLRDRFRIIVWDMPYHGKSSNTRSGTPFSQTSAGVICDLLDHLDIEEAVIVGLSLGSYVTQTMAYMHPERVRATVHIGGTPLCPPVTSLILLANPLVGLFIDLYPTRRVFRAFAEHRALKEETKAYMEQVARGNGKGVMKELTQEMLRDMSRGLPKHTPESKLLCHGDHEIGFVRKQMRKWHEQAPKSCLRVIEDAHHVANQDNPQGMNTVLVQFLDRIF